MSRALKRPLLTHIALLAFVLCLHPCRAATPTILSDGQISLAVDPTYHSRIYLGSAGGGVWRSDDQGLHWKPLTDQKASLGIGSSHAIAVDPSHPGTIYAGTSSFALLAESLAAATDGTWFQWLQQYQNQLPGGRIPKEVPCA